MRSLAQWIADYEVCHRHPVNRLIHHICVPAIQFSLLGLLWLVRLPLPSSWPYVLSNLACALILPVFIFYILLSWRIAVGMLLQTALMLVVINFLYLQHVLFEVSLVIFIAAWIGQFIGHHIEGKRPSFFQDLRFLLIGPLWVLVHFYERVGLHTDIGNNK